MQKKKKNSAGLSCNLVAKSVSQVHRFVYGASKRQIKVKEKKER